MLLKRLEFDILWIKFKKQSVPLLALILGVCGIATTSLFIKISVREMSVNSTLFNRLWIASIIFSFLNYYKTISLQISLKGSPKDALENPVELQPYQKIDLVLLATVSIVFLTGRFMWIYSLNETPVANAMILSSIAPLLTTLGGWLFLGQRFGSKFIVGLVISLLGSITLGLTELQKINIHLLGDGAALLSAFFLAASLLILEKIRDKFSPSNILLSRCLIGTILVFPLVLLFDDHILPTSRLGWFAVIGMAIIGETIGHGLVVYSMKYFSASLVAIFMLIEPIIAIILAWVFLSESVDSLTWLALVLMLIGVYLSKDNVKNLSPKVSSATD